MRNSRQFLVASTWMRLTISLLTCGHQLCAVDRPVEFKDSQTGQSASIETRKISPSISQGTGPTPTFFEGQWGKLGVRELILEIPDAHAALCEELETWKSGTEWKFNCDIGTVARILRNSGLNESIIATLTNPPFFQDRMGITTILPPDEILLDLTPQMRSLLYPQIGLPVRENKFQNATQFISGGFPRLAKTPSGLSKQTFDLINHLTYSKKGGGLYFSDLMLALSKAANDEERFRIVKSIAREISLHAWLELSDESDREAILSYWSAGERNQTGRTTLEAILENPEIRRLDLVHILPSLPKRLIHTYPAREEGLGNDMPDCFATAFSFFSNSMSPRMLDSESVLEIHSERYERATAPWKLGDVMMIQAPDGQWVHACNFVAGEILLTKNGQSSNSPWVFQTINEVLSNYLVDQSMQAFFFRLKPGFLE